MLAFGPTWPARRVGFQQQTFEKLFTSLFMTLRKELEQLQQTELEAVGGEGVSPSPLAVHTYYQLLFLQKFDFEKSLSSKILIKTIFLWWHGTMVTGGATPNPLYNKNYNIIFFLFRTKNSFKTIGYLLNRQYVFKRYLFYDIPLQYNQFLLVYNMFPDRFQKNQRQTKVEINKRLDYYRNNWQATKCQINKKNKHSKTKYRITTSILNLIDKFEFQRKICRQYSRKSIAKNQPPTKFAFQNQKYLLCYNKKIMIDADKQQQKNTLPQSQQFKTLKKL
eukprot:TRINITY_DN28984_c0_g1_i4.p1 TRINITY_DN28984_c0_g1~~TRINITY_DN28984_c0_g1_i4.p1  ORF type:complete len:278 (-),score=9.98 TRINITY_DN28984_c0_g1_i4:904-1737(-)